MDGHVACAGEESNAYRIRWGNREERNFLEYLDIDGRIIFILFLNYDS